MDLNDFTPDLWAPDFRWRHAHVLHRAGKKPGYRVDRQTRRAVRYLKRRASSSLPGDLLPVRAAESLYTGHQRSYVEALLLCADLTLDQVAGLLSVTEDTLQAYLTLFFDVPRENSTACLTRLIPPAALRLGDETPMDTRLKLAALSGGYRHLDAYLHPEAMTDETKAEMQQAVDSAILRDYAFGNFFAPLDEKRLQQVTRHVLKQEALTLRTARATTSTVLDDVAAFVMPSQPAPEPIELDLSLAATG